MITTAMATDKAEMETAFTDWLYNRAYWQQVNRGGRRGGGYYKLKPTDSDGNFINGRSFKAPWSGLVKRTFGNSTQEFHRAAHEWLRNQSVRFQESVQRKRGMAEAGE